MKPCSHTGCVLTDGHSGPHQKAEATEMRGPFSLKTQDGYWSNYMSPKAVDVGTAAWIAALDPDLRGGMIEAVARRGVEAVLEAIFASKRAVCVNCAESIFWNPRDQEWMHPYGMGGTRQCHYSRYATPPETNS